MKKTSKILLAFGLGFASNALAENPIIQTYYSPDPAPVVFGDTVCVYTGNDEGGSFFTMHGWRVSCTTDMVNWTDMGELILTNESFGGNAKKNGDWAAQVVRRNGKYYYYVTVESTRGGRAINVAVADKPEGPFKDARNGQHLAGPNWDYIDPTVWIDDDGQAWLYWGNPKLYYAKLKENMIEFYKDLTTIDKSFALEQLQAVFCNQEDNFVRSIQNLAEAISKPVSWVGQVHPLTSEIYNEPQWVQINSIPEYDEQGQLKGSFGIWRNIQGLMRKQEQLKRETERANDSGHQKSVFLANMTHEIRTPLNATHEIRTPLNAIVGFSDLLQAMEQPEEKRELIRIIHNNCDMLLRLINDILVLSSVDSTGLELIPEHVDFSKEFDVICQSLEQRVDNPNVEFQKENPLPSLMVTIDNGRIQQVITNFVTNAVKNTQQGHIRVGYRVDETADGRSIYLYCKDTGSGIPEDEQARIFERFVKLNDFVQGTGLGLSICKAIIEKCGGEIGVESEIGKGSTFWFRIPI